MPQDAVRTLATAMRSLLEQGRIALAAGDPARARKIAAAVANQDPASAEAFFILGMSEAELGNVRLGQALLEKASGLQRSAEYFAQSARCLLLLRHDEAASGALRDAEACLATGEVATPLTRDTLGCAFVRLGRHDASIQHFTAAVRGDPRRAQFRFNLAIALSFIGRVEEAERAFEALLVLAPDHARAYHALSGLRQQTEQRNHIANLQKSLERARDAESRLLLGYALSKELSDLERHKEAFCWLSRANAAHRRTLCYRSEDDAALFDAIEAAWTTPSDAGPDALPDDSPIFVVGMPRTGTTLVDRILASHPDVCSAGELQAFPVAVKRASGVRTRTILDAQTIACAANPDWAVLARTYLDQARPHVPPGYARFTDKFPGNFMYLGLIARAFPNARLVCLRRHPMETVLSNFKNLFASKSQYYNYSYDVEDIARYYVRFDRLLRLWSTVLPGRMLDLHYEQLVDDQEGQTKRLLAHCGLDWSETCLSFHSNRAPVSTPSAAQVRRPIYRDALSRWHRHEAALAPARRIFESHDIAV